MKCYEYDTCSRRRVVVGDVLSTQRRRRLILERDDVTQNVAENDVELFGAKMLRRVFDKDRGAAERNNLCVNLILLSSVFIVKLF